jgi:hypothetical protein
MNFREFMESSLRDQLNVPQNPLHHPEGDVARHTYMVRTALPLAIKMLHARQSEYPDGPFSNLDFNFSSQDMNLLRLGGLLHDIGKGPALNPETLSAHGHEDDEMFEKGMSRLGTPWQMMYKNAAPADKDVLWFMIRHHMSLDDRLGFGSRLRREIIDENGKYRNDRRVKLLLVLMMMDRIGRGGSPDMSRSQARDFVFGNKEPGDKRLNAMDKSSVAAKLQGDKEKFHRKPPAPNDPAIFVAMLKARNLDNSEIKKALKNKRPDLSQEEINRIIG